MKAQVIIRVLWVSLVLLAPAGLPVVSMEDAQSIGTTRRASLHSDGTQANRTSYLTAISNKGRYVAFDSLATNLVDDDTNNKKDIFVHDQQTGQTVRVSIHSNGTQGNDDSYSPSISADGRLVVFGSDSTNLVDVDTNVAADVFVHDRDTDTDGIFDEPGAVSTKLVSVSSSGVQANGGSGGYQTQQISADGCCVVFVSLATNLISGGTSSQNVFVRGLQSNITALVSRHTDGTKGNANASWPSISADGHYVAFWSNSSNLIGSDLDHDGTCELGEGCDTNERSDIFVRDAWSWQTTRISLHSNKGQANEGSYYSAISGDGRYVAFESEATNLVDNDTNGMKDVFVHDRQAGQTVRASVHSNGTQGDKDSSWMYIPSISSDGRFVAFQSAARNLVDGDTNNRIDIFVHDLKARQTSLVSVAADGALGNDSASAGFISMDGRYVVFVSAANNLVQDDTNGTSDVFVRDRGPQHDLSVDSVVPVQVLEGQPLVKGKATALKAVIRKYGSEAIRDVSVKATYGSTNLTTFYVAELANISAQKALIDDNTAFPLDFTTNEVTKTIYFFDSALAPSGNTFQASVTVDHQGSITETDETNNTAASAPMAVHETNWSGWALFPTLWMHYFRTDVGTTPLADFDTFYQASNEFLQGVYPISAQNFRPSRTLVVTTTVAYRGGDGRLSNLELANWWMDTLQRARLAKPGTDRFVSAVPQGWFASMTTELTNSTGVMYPSMPRMVLAEILAPPRGSQVVAHEIGHSFELDQTCEEYNPCNPTREDGIGNYAATGLWVDKRIPIQVSAARRVYCFMGSTGTHEIWIDTEDYTKLLNDHKTSMAAGGVADTQAILAAGRFFDNGDVTLDDWYVLPEAKIDPLESGDYTFEYQDASGGVLRQVAFDVPFAVEMSDTPLTETPFVFTIPYVAGTSRIVVRHSGEAKAEKVVSAHAPQVTIVSPNGGETLQDQTTIQWTGSDGDGDTLSYAVLYSADNGASWETLAINLAATSYTWNLAGLTAGSQYLVKVMATDGFNTGQDVSNAAFTIRGGILYLPMTLRQ